MLIFLKNCYPENYQSDADRMGALSNLLVSHGRRNNIIIANKNTLMEIIKSDLYSYNDKMYATEILETRKEFYQLKDQLKFYGVVDFGQLAKVEIMEVNERYEVTVGYGQYTAPRNAEASPLLTENDKDYAFYKIIADWYLRFELRGRFKLNFTHFLGAGSHCKPQFDRLSGNHPFLLCIVDSDRKHPQKGEGSTSAAFTQADRNINCGHVVKILDVREVENLIPLKVLKRIFQNCDASLVDTVNEIENQIAINESFKLYFDHKDGISLFKAIELDNEYGNFWLPFLANIPKFNSLDCLLESTCYGRRDCPKISGLGEGLLRLAILNLGETHLRDLFCDFEVITKKNWKDIGALLTSWGCVAPTRVARA